MRLSARVIPFVVLLSALILGACGDDGPTGPDGEFEGDARMSALIDGDRWEAEVTVAVNTETVGRIISVSGTGRGRGIAFAFFLVEGQNTYTLSDIGMNAIVTVGTDTYNAPVSIPGADGTSGTVNVTRYTEEGIAGTFQFKVGQRDSNPTVYRTITNGQFDVEFGTTTTPTLQRVIAALE